MSNESKLRVRRTFAAEFKREAEEPIRQEGLSVPEVARRLDVHAILLRKWQREAAEQEIRAFPANRHQTALEERCRRLRDVNAWMRREWEILKNDGLLREGAGVRSPLFIRSRIIVFMRPQNTEEFMFMDSSFRRAKWRIGMGKADMRCPLGFSAIELIVVMAVIGMLIAILLPAVMAAREAARRTECRNRLKQLVLAAHTHESSHGSLPGNGWGYWWIGEPDRGSGQKQPGGWIYQLLPELDQSSLRNLGAGQPDSDRFVILGELTARPLGFVRCPSRPAPELGERPPMARWWNAEERPRQNRTDYAINEGDFITDTDRGPSTLMAGDAPSYVWKNVTNATGVSFLRSAIRMRDITDGSSNTYFSGEKRVSSSHYGDFGDPGFDQSALGGVDLDITRWTIDPPTSDGPSIEARIFGSAHSGGCHMAMCDGSVRWVAYTIHPLTHRSLGNRHDGGPSSE